MMRLSIPWIFVVALGVTGCASTGGSGSASAPSSSSGSLASGTSRDTAPGRCNADAVQDLVGQEYSERAAENARTRAGASTLRALMPGQVMTMEYRPTRLTVVVGDNRRVQSVRCG